MDYSNLTMILHHKQDRLQRINLLDPSGAGTGKRVIAENVRSEAEARRIAACVNKFSGIPTVDVENLPGDGVIELARHILRLKVQRDELLALLKAERDCSWVDQAQHLASIDAAIAKCEAANG